MVLFIRSPWGQGIIVDKAVSYISDKTGTKVAVDKAYLSFGGNLVVEGVYLEDRAGDTLVYSRYLEAKLPVWPIIADKQIAIKDIQWKELRANIIRKDSIEGFNFQFLADAFATTDSTTTPTDSTAAYSFSLGKIDLSDINVVYNDAVSGMESNYKVGTLKAAVNTMDLDSLNFKLSETSLTNSAIKIKLIQPQDTTSSESSPLPHLTFDDINFKKVVFALDSEIDRLKLDLDLQDLSGSSVIVNLSDMQYSLDQLAAKDFYLDFHSDADNIDLNLDLIDLSGNTIFVDVNDPKYSLDELTLNDSFISFHTEPSNPTATSTSANNGFSWPPLTLEIGNGNLRNNQFNMSMDNSKIKRGEFNPNNIQLSNLNLIFDDLVMQNGLAKTNIHEANFTDASGLALHQLEANVLVDEKNLNFENLKLNLNNSKLVGDLKLNYNSLDEFIKNPQQGYVHLDIPTFNFNPKLAYFFQPGLKNDENFQKASKHAITGTIYADGAFSGIKIQKGKINWGPSTSLDVKGSVANPADPKTLSYQLDNIVAQTTPTDLAIFLDTTQIGISLPKSILLSGSATGTMNKVTTDLTLNTNEGNVIAKGTFGFGDTIEFNSGIELQNIQLQRLLKNDRLGPLSATIKANGTGSDINNLDARLKANIDSLKLPKYTIKNLPLSGSFREGKGHLKSSYKDDNLNLNLSSYVILDSIKTHAYLTMDVTGVNLQSLGFVDRDIRTGFIFNADFNGNASEYDVAAVIDRGVVVYDNNSYLLGDVTALAHITPDTTSLQINNKILDLDLQSNTEPLHLTTALKNHLYSYFYRDVMVADTIKDPVNVKFRGRLSADPVIDKVFIVNMKELDTIRMSMDFAEKERKLIANIEAPHINYNDYEVDSLTLDVSTAKDLFNFNLDFREIKAGPLQLPHTILRGEQQNNEMELVFQAFARDTTMIYVNSKIAGHRDELRYTIDPKDLTFNFKPWSIPETNEFLYTPQHLEFTDFNLSRNEQSIGFRDNLPTISQEHIALEFTNFNIQEILNYLNPNEELAKGEISGTVVLEKPLTDTGIVADATLENLELLGTNFGTLTFDGDALGGNKYNFNMATEGGDVVLTLAGDYVTVNETSNLNLNLDIHEFKMKALEGLTLGAIKDGSGNFTGKFNVQGSFLQPEYSGNLHFTNAQFTLTALNAPFLLKNETLDLNNNLIQLDNFTLTDSKNNDLVFNGEIGTETYLNPTFNLNVKANNFEAMNSTKEDNELFYGLAVITADVDVKGDLQIPVISGEANVKDVTNITYVMPSASVNMEERDGVVVFVNRDNPDAILTKRQKEESLQLMGYDISAYFTVEDNANFTIVIDEQSNDNFNVKGKGEFRYTMKPNGRMILSGVYEISGGHYEMSLYQLVNRRFELMPGGQIKWSGNPFDADLNIKAVYEVEASASPLMGPSLSGVDPNVKNQFRQTLPFYVYLNIDGELMQPKISFDLDMPEDNRGSVGGQVYGRIQQVNEQEGELNKQVFSLLVLNRFYPSSGNDGSNGGFDNFARDNINDAISDQLNTFSDQIFGNAGVDVSFKLDSFTDYQGSSPEDRTQLDIAARKKFLNDRLTIEVGSEVDIQGQNQSEQSNPVIGNFSILYDVTEDGRYQLKGFRKNAYENIFDGQIIMNGIALIFTQEFNKFSELWDLMFRSSKKIEKNEEKLPPNPADIEPNKN